MEQKSVRRNKSGKQAKVIEWSHVPASGLERLLQGEKIDANNYLLLRAGGYTDAEIKAHKAKTE